jgi:hypothetical protein
MLMFSMIAAFCALFIAGSYYYTAEAAGKGPWLWCAIGGVSFMAMGWVMSWVFVFIVEALGFPSKSAPAFILIAAFSGYLLAYVVTELVRMNHLQPSDSAAS